MKSTDDRKLFGTLIGASAASGDITDIPATQASAGNGRASIATAFPPETFIARAAGGNPPFGGDMNGFLKLLSNAIQILQAGYLGPFDAAFAQSIGGYPAGAIVCGATPGTFWVSTADANVSTPGADGAAWQSLFNGYATQAWANSLFATIAQLQAEASTRSSADTSLSNAITAESSRAQTAEAGKANLIGGNNLDGTQTVNQGNLTLAGDTNTPNNSQQVIIQRGDAWRYALDYAHDDTNGNYSRCIFYDANTQNVKDILYYFLDRGRLSSSSKGDYALVSELPTSGTISGGTYTKIPLNDGTGRSVLTQKFSIALATSNLQATVNFPIAFSAAPTSVVTSSNAGDMDTWVLKSETYADHCIVRVPSGGVTSGDISIIVEGIVS